jgi:hypothetical protein
MISLENILDMICTEAFEHGGVPEVPDHKHGAPLSYFAEKRDARGDMAHPERSQTSETALQYDLELVEDKKGNLDWLE